jgi:Nucleotide modification associated domain 1
MSQTSQQYDAAISAARNIFLKKAADYGTSWRVLRPISVADQIYIKARRIRQLQESKLQKIDDDIPSEFKGIINYAIIGLIQLDIQDEEIETLPLAECEQRYNEKVAAVKALMEMKNHDYGEAWRQMSQESFADLIMMKIYRMKQIIRNQGVTIMSEGLDANYMDILNYAVFALILLEEEAHPVSAHPLS